MADDNRLTSRLKPDSDILSTLTAFRDSHRRASPTPTRPTPNVVASEIGFVVGRLIFSDYGDMIDCSKMGCSGKGIPPNVDGVADMSTDALFILLVEKYSVFLRLAEQRFYNRFPCIVVCGATASFLIKLRTELKLPVLGLVDCAPDSLESLLAYGCGDIKWLGVRPSDLDKYAIPENCRLPMTERDIEMVNDMMEDKEFVKENPGWVEELSLMVETKRKAEIEAMSAIGFRYLTDVVLPLKLQEEDWL